MKVELADLVGNYRTGLLNAAVAAFDDEDVQTILGPPGTAQRDDIVSVGMPAIGLPDGDSATATISAAARNRNVKLTCAVVFSIFRRGGPEQEAVVTARYVDLLSKMERHIRVDDITLGGVVWWCLFTEAPEPDPVAVELNKAKGRLLHVPTTWVATGRLTNI